MMKRTLLIAALASTLSVTANATTYAYISSPGDGLISQYRLDQSNGALTLIEQIQAGD